MGKEAFVVLKKLDWNRISSHKEDQKDFGQILFLKEKKHWVFVYRKDGSGVNVCDSFRNNGKQG